jgi:hypothetical protein
MIVSFSPVLKEEKLKVEVSGDTITVNGEVFDFSPLPEGATLPNSAIESKWIVGDVTRKNGVINLMIVLPHGLNAPESTRFALPIFVFKDGPLTLPVYDIVVKEEKSEEVMHEELPEPEPEIEVPVIIDKSMDYEDVIEEEVIDMTVGLDQEEYIPNQDVEEEVIVEWPEVEVVDETVD